MNAFSLYVHIPYCQAKCPYCDFNSHAAQRWPEERYTAALCAEMRSYAQHPYWRGAAVQTIFFGGGTPSLFAPTSIHRILVEARKCWAIAADAEVTLEANPGTISEEKLAGFRAAGVNRMSFGVQSFAPHHLLTLGRIHSAAEAHTAVELARAVGFREVSLDLIFALHNQTLAEWEEDLAHACALRPDHISAYNLTYEEGTPFYQWKAQGKLRQLPEEIEVAMFNRTREALATAGYDQYEISNYAQPAHPCRHNLNYWRSGAYLGVGAGAHSYAPEIDATEWGRRWGNERSPNGYIAAVEARGQARVSEETLEARQARGEFMFLGLRCRAGVAAKAFRQRFGGELLALFPHVADLCADGLVECADDHWRLTERGLLLGDSVFATFL